MPIAPLTQFLKPISIPLNVIFLDPNNPRFTSASWVYVPDVNIADADVQDAAQRRMVRDFDVEKLRMNIEVNGFLSIDRVIVREFTAGKYVVLEGNRRISAAKLIGDYAIDGTKVNDQVKDSIKEIECLQYTGTDPDAAWVFQGIRHISGVVEWSAYNKAKLLVEQMEKEELQLAEVGKRFGLTPHGAGQWVRGYYAFKQARESSDYISEVDEVSYPFFQEIFSRSSPPIREWLEWDEAAYKFKNLLNFNEFIGWLYPRAQSVDEAGENSGKGNWEKRRLARRDDIRTVAGLLQENPEYFQQFRSGVSLEDAYSMAIAKKLEEKAKLEADPVADLYRAIEVCLNAVNNIPFKAMKNPEIKAQVQSKLAALQIAIGELN